MNSDSDWAGYVALSRGYGDYTTNVTEHSEVTRIAQELHEAEHAEAGGTVDECDIDWHTETWFRHRAAIVFNAGRGGR